ncbi:MAG: alpha/beta hydrolase [Pseudomonadota bacterium]
MTQQPHNILYEAEPMPIIRINAVDGRAELHGSSRPFVGALQQSQQTDGPVIIMTHGYKYRPEDPDACPHRHILSLRPRVTSWYSPSWPQHLGFGSGFQDEGLAIAFGWDARGPLWSAQRRAVEAGKVLAEVIQQLNQFNPQRTIHFIGHSMGTELALEALHHIPPGALCRIVSLTGATYQSRTIAALATPSGRRAEFINIISRENDLFDFLYETLVQPPCRGNLSIGAGLTAPNAVTLQIDCPTTLDYLSSLIFPLAAPKRRICHWSSYTRPGVLRVYNALLRDPERLCLRTLQLGIPKTPHQRWSRLFALPRPQRLLPFAQKAS